MTEAQAKALTKEIVDFLFCADENVRQPAVRLALMDEAGNDIGGWSKLGMSTHIQRILASKTKKKAKK